MNRRVFLSTVGLIGSSVAGCLSTNDSSDTGTPTAVSEPTTTPTEVPTTSVPLEGPRHGDELPTDDDPTDGYPPQFETRPEERAFDDSYFGSMIQQGTSVTLANVQACYYWYARGEARFVDARGPGQFDSQHIFGAVNSPTGEAALSEAEDPVTDWPTDDRIVSYCGCPHHLSSLRAAELQADGFQEVFVLNEGYWEWNNRGYPRAGAETDRKPPSRLIEGSTASRYAGETVWAIHDPSQQFEAGPIDASGRYHLDVKFVDVTPTTEIRLQTPAYEIRAPLGELTSGIVTGSSDPSS